MADEAVAAARTGVERGVIKRWAMQIAHRAGALEIGGVRAAQPRQFDMEQAPCSENEG